MNRVLGNRSICILIILILLLATSVNIYAEEQGFGPERITGELELTGKYLTKAIPNPTYGIVGGDWSHIALVRSGIKLAEGYSQKYLNNVIKILKEKDGELSRNKYSEYSRLILAITALGKDPAQVGGYNLIEKISDLDLIERQGINGPIYALIALDSLAYKEFKNKEAKTQATRDLLIDAIITREIQGGGFSLAGDKADPDVTAAALQALGNYVDRKEVKEVVDRGLTFLSGVQTSTGGFSGWITGGIENTESIAQVIIALTALGIDPHDDSRFLEIDKEGRKHTPLDALYSFRLRDGSYMHLKGGDSDIMATEQAMLALVSYDRFKSKKSPIYDMRDAKDLPPGESYQYKVLLNGEYLVFDDQPPINIKGRILVPMRVIFESLGGVVDWDPIQRKVLGSGEGKKIELTIGEDHAYIDGEKVGLANANEPSVPAMIKNGRTLVPLRFISESLKAKVDWDGQTNTAIIEKQ